MIIHSSSFFFRIIHYSFLNFVWYSFFFTPWTWARFFLVKFDFRFNDYTFDYRYHTVASYYTLLPHRSTHGDLFVKMSWCCIFRCYGHYYNVIFALTATSLFRKQLHRRTCLSCSSYWWQIFTNITWMMFGKTTK